MILYLHGFRSSPLSFKARMTADRMAARGRGDAFMCPQLPASPKAAMALCLRLVAHYDSEELALIGSSLGGFYATWLAEQLDCRAVLLNPAVHPFQDLERHVGVSTQYHSDAPFEFKRDYLAELDDLAVPAISAPDRYYLIAASGDEVLDYRQMVSHYAGARQTIIDGSDHALSDYAEHVDAVLAFCGEGGRR
ncbi:YqiA/YcfP family alpha/beta fold hydrolase [Massilia sp. TS11]|uniref:YqiA/YcfP family alpha/beta fold hydrolase n=1 Tax=Massilia sp. TS11 TaxID=2908003 RepID=UPI001EDBD72F|nr:YqiA/YcfP family alpha/beta fold hydrolase [Massilia sp. TS11]MCG2583442.1 esterase [Massilia sp. TS11]